MELIYENKVIDAFVLYQILRRLTLPFNKTDAFRLGIIDKNGKALKKRAELKTTEERNAYTYFDVLIFNLKRLIELLPFGKTRLATFASAVLLLQENAETVVENSDLFFQHFNNLSCHQLTEITELCENVLSIGSSFLLEDLPANNVGSGNIAGTVGDPPVSKAKQNKYTKKKRDDDFQERGRKLMQFESFKKRTH